MSQDGNLCRRNRWLYVGRRRTSRRCRRGRRCGLRLCWGGRRHAVDLDPELTFLGRQDITVVFTAADCKPISRLNERLVYGWMKPGKLHVVHVERVRLSAVSCQISGRILLMKNESLLRTNPYLRDPERLKWLLAATVCTSSAIEGVVFTVAETLAGRHTKRLIRSPRQSAASASARG